jgi:hypothetical protein
MSRSPSRCTSDASDNSTDDEVEQNTRTSEQQVNGSYLYLCQPSHSPTRRATDASDSNDSEHEDYSHSTVAQHNTTVRPQNSSKFNRQQQDDDPSIHQLQSATHETMDTHSTYVSTSQPHNNRPSANRKMHSNPPDQSGDSMKSTIFSLSLSQQLSEDSQSNLKVNDAYTTHHFQLLSLHTAAVNGNTSLSSFSRQSSEDTSKVKAADNVAKYTWDSNIPSYWAPMDGSSAKTVVLHPTDSEYQLVADTFLASLRNTLATVVQVY